MERQLHPRTPGNHPTYKHQPPCCVKPLRCNSLTGCGTRRSNAQIYTVGGFHGRHKCRVKPLKGDSLTGRRTSTYPIRVFLALLSGPVREDIQFVDSVCQLELEADAKLHDAWEELMHNRTRRMWRFHSALSWDDPRRLSDGGAI